MLKYSLISALTSTHGVFSKDIEPIDPKKGVASALCENKITGASPDGGMMNAI